MNHSQKINENKIWLNNHLDFIKDDAGFETQEEFDQQYKTLCPINMVDIIWLEKSINDEIHDIEKYCKKNNTPITASHIIESLRLGPLGQFEDTLGQRRDRHKDGFKVLEEVNRWRNNAA